jgi:alpha-1,6-mannosyltransferase
VLLALAGPRLVGGPVRWFFDPKIPPGGEANRIALYLGIAMLGAGWLGLWRYARADRATPRELWPVGVLWSLAPAIAAPLFSHDVYSYLAQGTIAHLGLSPYNVAPSALAGLGHAHVMSAVDPFWRHATAPYGPLFLVIGSGIAALTGSHLVAGVLLVRLLELVGLVLLWAFVPRLARALGADPTRAAWLAALSPLVLLQLVAATHNDLLMIGLMVAGVTLAVEGRPLAGIAVCAVAMTIKLPAGVAALFIAVAWLHAGGSWGARARRGAEAVAVVAGVAAVVSVATGWGLHWVSASLFSTPARVRLAITPATGIAWTLSSLLNDVGAHVSFHHLESVTRVVSAVITAAFALAMLVRTRPGNLVRPLGLALLALAFGGPAAWPWYFTWGVVLLAATKPFQRNRAVPVALIAAAFLVKPNGILLLPLQSAPYVLLVYLLIAGVAWYAWSRRRRRPDTRPAFAEGAAPAPRSALARSSGG